MSCPFLNPNGKSHGKDSDGGGTFNKLMTSIQGSPDAAFLLDREGKILYRNKAAQLMFLTDVTNMSLCRLFEFPNRPGKVCWDNLVENLTISKPENHDVVVLEQDGSELGFRINLVKLSPEMMGTVKENQEVFACAYVIPALVNIDGFADNDSGSVCSNSSGGSHSSINKNIRDILAGKDAQLHRHMRDVVQASLDPMFSLFENGTIWMANDPAIRLFGYSHAEIIGKNIVSICPASRFTRRVHTTSGKQTNATAIHKSGKELPVELGISLIQSFDSSGERVYFAHMKDLTVIEEQQAMIKHKDNLCQAMINASFDPMFSIDQRGVILVVNEAACSMFGYSQAEFINQNISMICNDRDAKNHDQHLARYLRTGEKRVIGKKRPLMAKRKDGTEFHIELGVSEVSLSNGERMFCGYVRDMTQQRLDKQMLRRKEALIQEKFFHVGPEDARGAMKRHVSIPRQVGTTSES